MTLHWFLEDDKDEEVAYHMKHIEDQQCNEEELCSPVPLLTGGKDPYTQGAHCEHIGSADNV